MVDLFTAKNSNAKTKVAGKPVETVVDVPINKETVVDKSMSGATNPKTIKTGLSEAQIRNFLPPKRGSSLSSYIVLPSEKVRFETQDPEEKILMMLRRHWITNVPWIAIAVLLFFAPRVLVYFPLISSFPTDFQTVFVVIWYLIVLMFVFEQFLKWFFNLTIITDERLIDVDFVNLTNKKVSDCDLDKIQDVSFTNSGALGAIFNYGDLLVQTAAELVEFVSDDIPNPAHVAEILQRLRNEEKVEAIEGRVN